MVAFDHRGVMSSRSLGTRGGAAVPKITHHSPTPRARSIDLPFGSVRAHSHDPPGHLSPACCGRHSRHHPKTCSAPRGRPLPWPLRRRSVPVIVRDGGRFDTDARYRRTRATHGCQRVDPEGLCEFSDFHRHGGYVAMFALPDPPQPLSPPGARSSDRKATQHSTARDTDLGLTHTAIHPL